MVDTHSRYCPTTDARFTYRGEDVVQTLESICRKSGYPKTIRVDNGSEFISRDLDLWAYANNVTLDFSRPGKPTDNGFIEAFNSKLRSECLNAYWFLTLADSREKLETWRRYYNEERPHSAIGYNVPIALHNRNVASVDMMLLFTSPEELVFDAFTASANIVDVACLPDVFVAELCVLDKVRLPIMVM